jgi:hypothetical protein
MRKFVYLTAAAAIIAAGVIVVAQSKLVVPGAAAPAMAATISPLDIHARADLSVLPVQAIADLI